MNKENYKKLNILYINNSQFDRLLVQSLIVPHCNVIFIENVEKAISLLYSNNIDLLVIDEKMNQKNSYQEPLFLQIKRMNIIEESKVFVLASSHINEELNNSELTGANIFIKPLIKEDIYMQMKCVA